MSLGLVSKCIRLYNKYPRVKKVPYFGEILYSMSIMHYDDNARIRVQRFLAPFVFARTCHRIAPRKYAGGIILNTLGFQVIRMIYFNLSYRFRKRKQLGLEEKDRWVVEELDRNGVVCIKNFFSEQEALLLAKDFSSKSEFFVRHYDEFYEGIIEPTNSVVPWSKPIGSEIARNLIQKNKKLNELMEKISRRKLNLDPDITYLEYRYRGGTGGDSHPDGQDIIHSDVVHNSFKVFIYASDTSVKNGAFQYFVGTHKLSLKRLLFEYISSIKYYFYEYKGEHKPIKYPESFLKDFSNNKINLEGKVGTLIIFNTMGYHCRGQFFGSEDLKRKVILSNYRYVDSLANKFTWRAF